MKEAIVRQRGDVQTLRRCGNRNRASPARHHRRGAVGRRFPAHGMPPRLRITKPCAGSGSPTTLRRRRFRSGSGRPPLEPLNRGLAVRHGVAWEDGADGEADAFAMKASGLPLSVQVDAGDGKGGGEPAEPASPEIGLRRWVAVEPAATMIFTREATRPGTTAFWTQQASGLDTARQHQGRSGFSLTELSVALTIIALLAVTTNALLFGPLRDHQFMTFAVLVCGDFQRALSQAQTSYRPIRMNLRPEQDAFYQLEIQIDRGWHTLSLPIKHNRYQSQIAMAIKQPLPHPHNAGEQLSLAFRSSHAPYFYFRRQGSSSGTLAFSDPAGRTLCFVLAGDTNRLRAYLWLPSQNQWQALL